MALFKSKKLKPQQRPNQQAQHHRIPPTAAVRKAIAAGAVSRSDIARRSGLAPTTVDAVLAHLERSGAVTRELLASSCASGSCASCETGCATYPEGTAGIAPRRGAVILKLTEVPPE